MPDGDDKDSAFFTKISKYLHPTSTEKRAAAERERTIGTDKTGTTPVKFESEKFMRT